MVLFNVTGHDVNIVVDGVERVIAPMSKLYPARLVTIRDSIGKADGIPLVTSRTVGVEHLPATRTGAVFIASLPVAQWAAANGRNDVVSPDTGPTAIRDAAGQVTAVQALIFWRQ